MSEPPIYRSALRRSLFVLAAVAMAVVVAASLVPVFMRGDSGFIFPQLYSLFAVVAGLAIAVIAVLMMTVAIDNDSGNPPAFGMPTGSGSAAAQDAGPTLAVRIFRRQVLLCLGIVLLFVAAPMGLVVCFDRLKRAEELPPLRPAPAVTLQKVLLGQLNTYQSDPFVALRLDAIPRGTDAGGLTTLLSEMQRTREPGGATTYTMNLTTWGTPDGGTEIESLVIRVDGDPPRVTSIGLQRSPQSSGMQKRKRD